MDTTRSLPSGTVTFLFTDIEGSTKLWDEHPEAMRVALARHDALLRGAIVTHGGFVFKTMGDQFCAAFATAPDALAAALEAQRALHAEPWGEFPSVRVRMALHTGGAQERDGDYFGPPLNRVARLLEAAHGGQTLLSLATEELVREALPRQASLSDLGVHRLKDLQQPEHLFQLLHPALPVDFAPLRSLDTVPNNLPQQVTSFIGREKEITEVKGILKGTRLLTLTGPGGTGKTRLALQVAADLLEGPGDGVWLVELAPLSDPTLVPQVVASVLGVREQPGRPLTATLVEQLKPKKLLLVLDNCEHVLSACATLADALLRDCPGVCLLATSREGLNIPGEAPYRLRSLSVPHPRHLPATREELIRYEAAQLFLDRATTVAPSFTITDQNAAAVAEVCHRLDGIPLAIQLAAVRVKALPVEKLNERLDDMFRLLTGGSRTALPRQQTLRALIDWSYNLLSEPERMLLRRLSIFAGGWTLEAAEAVCVGDGIEEWEVLDLLTWLVEKSLVLYEEQASEARYRLLETVRQYACDRLLDSGETEAVRHRHAEYFLQRAERVEPQLYGPEQALAAAQLELEYDNVRAALTWFGSAEDGAEAQLRLTGALWHFWFIRGYYREGRQRAEEALSRAPHAAAPVRAKGLLAAGVLTRLMGDYAAADPLLEESIALARAAGQKWDVAFALFHWAMLAIDQREYEQATARAQECLTVAEAVGDPRLRALPLVILGQAALHQGDAVSARSFSEEHLAVSRSQGNRFLIGRATLFLANVVLYQGECEQARALYHEALTQSRGVADRRAIAGCLSGLAVLAGTQAQPERAARLFGAAEALREVIGSQRMLMDYPGYEHTVTAVRAYLGEETFAAAWAEGRAMTLKQSVVYALEQPGADTPAR